MRAALGSGSENGKAEVDKRHLLIKLLGLNN